ncbi:MAG: hypothetical protein AAF206_10935 [Bacteroidota bacterium]
MHRSISFLFISLFVHLIMAQDGFIDVEGTRFIKNGKPYYYLGTNFWYGMNLGAEGPGGKRDRLIRELDRLSGLGVNNLRIMAASEGPDDQPWRMVPAMQTARGQYNEDLLTGLDFLLDEMGKRDMHAVVCLANFWPWSGGMGQYLVWEEGGSIPYPPPAEGGSWHTYQTFTTRFYKSEAAMQAYENHLRTIIERTNGINGKAYTEDPTIMAWQMANEPRGILRPDAYRSWLQRTATFIKSLDQNHLVSIGSEGNTSSKYAGTNFAKDHAIEGVDYTTIHIWIQNWMWYNPEKHDKTFPKAEKKAKKYLKKHLKKAAKLNKPMVLEEFGIARDLDDHSHEASTNARDAYYASMFAEIHRRAEKGQAIAGCNFWAWGGEGRPSAPKSVWKAGDDFIGDPPHEYQGWYSVYEIDTSTLEVIREFAAKMNAL